MLIVIFLFQKVYNFGYYIPLKKHTKAQKRKENRQRGRIGAHSFNSQQRNTQIFPADELSENNIRHAAARLAKEKIDQLQSENANSKGKDTKKEIVQDVIDLSSDDDLDIIIESEKEKVDKSEDSDRNDHMEIENERLKDSKDKNDVCKDSIEDILIDDDSSSRHGSSRYDSSFYSDDDSSNFDDVESHPVSLEKK